MRWPPTLALALAGCAFDAGGVERDPGAADGGAAVPDAPPEAPEVPPDSGPEVPPDSGPEVPPDSGAAGCPDAYAAVGGAAHRYRYVTAATTHLAAALDCGDDPGITYLVVVDDQLEENALQGLVGGDDVWLGVTDAALEGAWVTVLASPATFLRWAPGEPNDSGDCAEREDKNRWDDTGCDGVRGYVCECEP